MRNVFFRELAESFNGVCFPQIPLGQAVTSARVEVFLLLHQSLRVRAFLAASMPSNFFEVFYLRAPFADSGFM